MLKNLLNKRTLSEQEAKTLVEQMMEGEIEDEQVAAILSVLQFRGETVDELVGFAKGMQEKSVQINPNQLVLDTCGTGGDGIGTYNVSTAVALLVSSLNIPVAKHGNRSVSSKTGSADVLEYLGIPIQTTSEEALKQLQRNNLCFLYAPIYHSAMKQVANARKKIGVKTIFNLLGPLTNPAGATHRLIGVYSREQGRKMALASKDLGIKRALFVTGSDGLDEMTITGETYVTELKDNKISEYTITPESLGLKRGELQNTLVQSPQESGKLILNIFRKKAPEEATNLLLMNAGAALYIAGKSESIAEGVEMARANLGVNILDHLKKLQLEKKEVIAQ
ncbi:anthranilate phosphoribosyltransferase [Bacillus shivajii]|uniref:anthranilate phosphoribosyltransferase n=1 Tax=Bacillus shivajii TaxID=1983719 RepID=UPI0038502B85